MHDTLSFSSSDLEIQLGVLGSKARNQVPEIIANSYYEWRGEKTYNNAEHRCPDIVTWAQVVDLGATFDYVPDQLPREELIGTLQGFQDPQTGLFNYTPWGEKQSLLLPEGGQGDKGIIAIGCALELLGEKMLYPIRAIDVLSVEQLYALLDNLEWETTAWYAGSWVDSLGTAMYFNKKDFDCFPPFEALFEWLDSHVDSRSGLWGSWTKEQQWLHPVNGYYRLIRGTYAQFGREVPYPETAIDTILTHAQNRTFFNDSAGTCCDVLDVAYPLRLCMKQTDHRKGEIHELAAHLLQRPLSRWLDGEGFSFTLEQGAHPTNTPNIKHTKQWLATVYFLADLLECPDACGYTPTGVHRTDVAMQLR